MSRYCCTVLILVHAISHLDLCTSLQIGLPTCHSPALTVAFPGTSCPPISSKRAHTHTHTLQTKNHTQIHTLNTPPKKRIHRQQTHTHPQIQQNTLSSHTNLPPFPTPSLSPISRPLLGLKQDVLASPSYHSLMSLEVLTYPSTSNSKHPFSLKSAELVPSPFQAARSQCTNKFC